MDKPSLSEPALRRIKAASLEAGADLLNGLDAFWRDIGMSAKALREHDPFELMPLFERYVEKQFDAEAKEWLACFSDPDAYSTHLELLPMTIAARICPGVGVLPEDVSATGWTELYHTLKARVAESGWSAVMEEFQQPSGDWENYLDHSFSRRFLKGRVSTMKPDRDSAVKNFMLLFWLKYLFHLRLFANNLRCINRLCTHLSVRYKVWLGQACRQRCRRSVGRNPITTPPCASLRLSRALRRTATGVRICVRSAKPWTKDMSRFLRPGGATGIAEAGASASNGTLSSRPLSIGFD